MTQEEDEYLNATYESVNQQVNHNEGEFQNNAVISMETQELVLENEASPVVECQETAVEKDMKKKNVTHVGTKRKLSKSDPVLKDLEVKLKDSPKRAKTTWSSAELQLHTLNLLSKDLTAKNKALDFFAETFDDKREFQ